MTRASVTQARVDELANMIEDLGQFGLTNPIRKNLNEVALQLAIGLKGRTFRYYGERKMKDNDGLHFPTYMGDFWVGQHRFTVIFKRSPHEQFTSVIVDRITKLDGDRYRVVLSSGRAFMVEKGWPWIPRL